MPTNLNDLIRMINAGGVVSVLILGIWLGLRGDIVTAEQLRDCRMMRDAYLRDLLQQSLPPDTSNRMPPSLRESLVPKP